MSKRELKKYIHSLKKAELEDQIMDLYDRFKDVKVFYDFVFNPNEKKLVEECKVKISKEYFPVNGRRPKARRSVAKKYIQHYMTLGLENSLIADIMLFNIELVQTYSAQIFIKQDAFYKSIYTSFSQTITFLDNCGLYQEFKPRLKAIEQEAYQQKWINSQSFTTALERLSYPH